MSSLSATSPSSAELFGAQASPDDPLLMSFLADRTWMNFAIAEPRATEHSLTRDVFAGGNSEMTIFRKPPTHVKEPQQGDQHSPTRRRVRARELAASERKAKEWIAAELVRLKRLTEPRGGE